MGHRVTRLTGTRTRDRHVAVKRRCLYHWMDYPDRDRELAIVRRQVPEAGQALARQVADVLARLRGPEWAEQFQRSPGIAETVEWTRALTALGTQSIDPEVITQTAGLLYKQREDIETLTRAASLVLQPA